MTKTFFVIIPFSSGPLSIQKGALNAVGGLINFNKKPAQGSGEVVDSFEEQKVQLQQRISVVEQGLVRCGLRVAHLGSEEVIELLYRLFNPGENDKPIPLK